jgi:hypothetical protein
MTSMRAVHCFVCCVLASNSAFADSPQSGLRIGQRPGPYSAVISTGPERGQSYCYICETADKPAVVIFARSVNDTLAKLVKSLDKAVDENKRADLRVWVTFLNSDQLSLDPRIVQWAQKHGIRNIPMGVFEDADGPPSYRLSRDAEMTILLFVRQKVVANFAYRSNEMGEAQVAEILKSLPRITGSK